MLHCCEAHLKRLEGGRPASHHARTSLRTGQAEIKDLVRLATPWAGRLGATVSHGPISLTFCRIRIWAKAK